LATAILFTQNAAGVTQIGICVALSLGNQVNGAGGGHGDGCGGMSGLPVIVFPYGDQIPDAVDIQNGYNYEIAKLAGCQ
jgi:hypothetical protein